MLLAGVYVKRRFCELCGPLVEAEWEAEQKVRAATSLLVRAGMTDRLEPLSLETYPRDAAGRHAVACAEAWLATFAGGTSANLLVFGGVGSGKSGLAWGIARRLVEEEVASYFARPAHERQGPPWCPVLFVVWRDLLAEMRFAMSSDDWAGISLGRVAAGVPVLCLDDLGAERPTEWALEQLAGLVEHRYANQRPTIVTSNYEPAELGRRLGREEAVIGERIVSRLVDGAMQLRIDGPDRRLA